MRSAFLFILAAFRFFGIDPRSPIETEPAARRSLQNGLLTRDDTGKAILVAVMKFIHSRGVLFEV
jgi:hypothetical protein